MQKTGNLGPSYWYYIESWAKFPVCRSQSFENSSVVASNLEIFENGREVEVFGVHNFSRTPALLNFRVYNFRVDNFRVHSTPLHSCHYFTNSPRRLAPPPRFADLKLRREGQSNCIDPWHPAEQTRDGLAKVRERDPSRQERETLFFFLNWERETEQLNLFPFFLLPFFEREG